MKIVIIYETVFFNKKFCFTIFFKNKLFEMKKKYALKIDFKNYFNVIYFIKR